MIVTLQPVVFRGRLAAAAATNRFYLAPHVEALESDHPDRLFVSLMCCYARDSIAGEIPGPYDDSAAERNVRDVLIGDEDFLACFHLDDATLAERYEVPLDQIRCKRLDLHGVPRAHSRGRGV